jgi:hypothetical protein
VLALAPMGGKMTAVSVGKVRRNLYLAARILGDVQAARSGPAGVSKRIIRRRAYRASGAATRRLLRMLGL